jgi:ribosomal protein S18 acetylase RimI-like enzyme
VLYTLLDYLAVQNLPIPAGFIHLPSLPEQASRQTPSFASMSLETSLDGIRAAIRVLSVKIFQERSSPQAVSVALSSPGDKCLIRRATLQDLEALVELRLALHREVSTNHGNPLEESLVPSLVSANRAYLQERLPRDELLSWVAEVDGKLVACSGLIIYHRLPAMHTGSTREAYIVNMYTRPEYRRLGIASALLREILQFASGSGVRRAWLRATPEGWPLYEKFGFQAAPNVMELKLDGSGVE